MLKLWGKLIKQHKIVRDVVLDMALITDSAQTVRAALDDFAPALDIARPIWLPKNETDLTKFIITRFYPDQFMESVDFDWLEIEIIGDDRKQKNRLSHDKERQ